MTRKQENSLKRTIQLNRLAYELAVKVLNGESGLMLAAQEAETKADLAWEEIMAKLKNEVCACGTPLGSILEIIDGRCGRCEPRWSEVHHYARG